MIGALESRAVEVKARTDGSAGVWGSWRPCFFPLISFPFTSRNWSVCMVKEARARGRIRGNIEPRVYVLAARRRWDLASVASSQAILSVRPRAPSAMNAALNHVDLHPVESPGIVDYKMKRGRSWTNGVRLEFEVVFGYKKKAARDCTYPFLRFNVRFSQP